MKRANKWWRPLLDVVIVLAVDIVAVVAAILIDAFLVRETEAMGHGFPGVTTLVIWLMALITSVVVVRSVVLTITGLFKKEPKNSDDGSEVTAGDKGAAKPLKPAYSYFIPWSLQVLISTIIVYVIGRYEIESFYNDPHHIGFAIPITAFVAAFFLFVLAVITFFISLFVYRRARRKAEGLNK